MTAWVLPDHIADVLPSEARHIEELRRLCLDTARVFGYELVIPPLIEHIESLLSGTGSTLDLQTFKMVDQLSGRTLGLRVDTTPQVARIDAHLLNRAGVTRLCYCGPTLHTRAPPYATREPLQLGAEIYGHAGLEADLEILQLALQFLHVSGISSFHVDLSDARILPALLRGQGLASSQQEAIAQALSGKDISAMRRIGASLPTSLCEALVALVQLYGGPDVLDQAEEIFKDWPDVLLALSQMRWLATHVYGHQVSIDLADLRGATYYSGPRFAVFVPEASDALVRGGRYDEVGALFGRKRPAAGFSLDIKALVSLIQRPVPQAAIRAPWEEDEGLHQAITLLRQQGHTVVCMLPGHDSEVDEFHCDRELVLLKGQWILQPLAST